MDETFVLQGAVRETIRVSRSPDDARKVISRVASGDRRALEEIYARHGRELFRYLSTLTPDRHVAEEILQDTLVAVWRSANSYERRSGLRTWIFGIARRQAHNTLRKKMLPIAETSLEEPAAGDMEPEKILLARLRERELTDHIKDLSTWHREVLALIFFHELSYKETAQVLGVPIGTVKSRLSNAKRALRKKLEESEL